MNSRPDLTNLGQMVLITFTSQSSKGKHHRIIRLLTKCRSKIRTIRLYTCVKEIMNNDAYHCSSFVHLLVQRPKRTTEFHQLKLTIFGSSLVWIVKPAKPFHGPTMALNPLCWRIFVKILRRYYTLIEAFPRRASNIFQNRRMTREKQENKCKQLQTHANVAYESQRLELQLQTS